MIQTDSLVFEYNKDVSFHFPDLQCNSGETLLILGNSGSGKTTLLNLLASFLSPKSGKIIVNQQKIESFSNQQKVKFRAENIGIIYQKPYFIQALNVLDNLLLANYLSNNKLDKIKAKNLANELGFEKKLKANITELSGGEQQRVCIARALMNSPSVILADEPSSALDNENCEKVIELLKSVSKKIDAALIIVTHDQRLKSEFENQLILN